MPRKARKISQTLNGRAEWVGAHGGYFKLLASTTAVDVELWREGVDVMVAVGVDAGWYFRGDFDRVVITTPSSQQVDWLYAPIEAGLDRFILTGSVSVQDLGWLPGAEYAASTVFVANTPQNIIAAASNLNGVRVHALGASLYVGVLAVDAAFVAKATAPASPIDGDQVFHVTGHAIADFATPRAWLFGESGLARRIASGKRLDIILDAATVGEQVSARYTLL